MLIFGVSDHAKVILDLARAAGVTVVGFIANDASAREFAGLPVLGMEEALNHPPGQVAVSATNPETRRVLYEQFSSHGWRPRSLVHPTAIVAENARMEAGVCVLAGAIVQPGVSIGGGALVGARSVIELDAKISGFAHVASGAVIGGHAQIGVGTWIGANACVANNVNVGAWSMIGPGAAVVEDVPDEVSVEGVPARITKHGRHFPVQSAPAMAPAAPPKGSVRDTVSDVINSILNDTGREPRPFANEDVLMGNIGLDSLDLAVMTVSLEQRTGIDPFRTGRGAVRTFGELVAVYEAALAGSAK